MKREKVRAVKKALVIIPNIHEGNSERAGRAVKALERAGYDCQWFSPSAPLDCISRKGGAIVILIGYVPNAAKEIAIVCGSPGRTILIEEEEGHGFIRFGDTTLVDAEALEAILDQLGR